MDYLRNPPRFCFGRWAGLQSREAMRAQRRAHCSLSSYLDELGWNDAAQSDAHDTDSWNIFRFYLEHYGFDLVFNKSTRSNFAPYFYSLYEVSWVLKLVMYHF